MMCQDRQKHGRITPFIILGFESRGLACLPPLAGRSHNIMVAIHYGQLVVTDYNKKTLKNITKEATSYMRHLYWFFQGDKRP